MLVTRKEGCFYVDDANFCKDTPQQVARINKILYNNPYQTVGDMLQKQFDIDHQVTILKAGGDWVWFVNDFDGNVIDSPITFPSWQLARLN